MLYSIYFIQIYIKAAFNNWGIHNDTTLLLAEQTLEASDKQNTDMKTPNNSMKSVNVGVSTYI